MESTDCGSSCPFKKGTQKISVCDKILNMKSDSFHVDMEPISHLTKDSRFHLQRSSSRNGQDKKMSNPSVDNGKDANSSPKERITEPQVHHQITIITSGNATNTMIGTPTKSRLFVKRSNSFKQTFIINPRSILLFFATLSSMGTILLIYLTLSMVKHNGEDNLLNE